MPADVLALIGPPKKGAAPDDEAAEGEAPPGEPSMNDAKMMAAEDAMAAFESGDAKALDDALTRHYEACAAEKGL